jgi:hypothetical protein
MHDSSDHFPYNHHIAMVEIEKIVSEKRGWVSLHQLNLQERAIVLLIFLGY